MEQFMAMVHDILTKYRSKLNYTTMASYRIDVINEMKAELLLMKETYEAINGPIAGTGPSFEEVMKQITN